MYQFLMIFNPNLKSLSPKVSSPKLHLLWQIKASFMIKIQEKDFIINQKTISQKKSNNTSEWD